MSKSWKDIKIELPSNYNRYKGIRKKSLRRPQTFRDQKNDYQRDNRWDVEN